MTFPWDFAVRSERGLQLGPAVQVFVVPNISNEWPLKDWDCADAEKKNEKNETRTQSC